MKGAIRIGSYRGIAVFIHWTFFLLLAWIGGEQALQGGGMEGVTRELILVLCIFLCVLLHEFGHALAARRYKIQTRDITLLPIGGVARLEKMPEAPMQEFVVAIAGPLVNVVIIALLIPLVLLGKGFPIAFDFDDLAANSLAVNLILVNFSLVVFNLIPAFPMDGGRIFRSLLALKFHRLRATRMAARLGQAIAVLFVIGGLYGNPVLILIGVFVFMGARAELASMEQEHALAGIKVRHIMQTAFRTIHPDATLSVAAKMLLEGDATDFLVVDDRGEVQGVLTRTNLLLGYAHLSQDHPVRAAAVPALASLQAADSADKAWEQFRSGDAVLFPVLENNKLCGILTRENTNEFIALYLAGLHPSHQ